MTDEQIMKALECCSRHGDCEGCPWENDECITAEGTSILMHETLDLISRQKAGVEQWKEEANKYQSAWCEAVKDIQTAKSEAIREFAERLKINIDAGELYVKHDDYILTMEHIDNTAKEMVGDSDA